MVRGALQALCAVLPVSVMVVLCVAREFSIYGVTHDFDWRVVAMGVLTPIIYAPTLAIPLMAVAWREEPMEDGFRVFRTGPLRRPVPLGAIAGAAVLGFLLGTSVFALVDDALRRAGW